MLAYRVVCCSHQSDRIVYVSRTSQIAAFEYPAPITAFGYCFLVNDVMDQRMTLIRNYGLICLGLSNGLWLLREPLRLRPRFIGVRRVRI